MAITINQQPPELIAAYSDITMSVSSNLVISRYKFKYVYDIFAQTTGIYQYLGRVKQTPNPSGYGILDLSRYLQLQLSGNTFNNEAHNLTLPTLNTDLISEQNTYGFCSYYIMCGEEYATTLYGTVSLYNGDGTLCSGTTLSSLQTNICNVYNGANQFEDGYNPSMSEYFLASGRTFASNAPRTQYREQDENITFGGFYGPYSGVTLGFSSAMNYSIYNTSNSLIATGVTSAGITGGGSIPRVWYGSVNLNQIVSGYTNSWNKVIIYFGDKSLTSYSAYTENMTIYNKGCPWDKYDPKDVIFLNRYGIWETFRFYGSKNEEVKIQRETYQRAYGTWSSATYGYNTYERGTTNLKTDLTIEGEVMSDFIDEDTVNWLEELLTSPSVFFIENNKMVPINITDNNFKKQIKGNVRLRQVSFKYEKSNQLRTQQQS